MNPPPELAKLNEKMLEDVSLRDSDEGKHWLCLYGLGTRVLTTGLISILTKPSGASVRSDGIELSHDQQLVFEQAEALLHLTDATFTDWNRPTAALAIPPSLHHQSEQERRAWIGNVKPVIERIIAHVESLRTPSWQQDPKTKPAVLPSTYNLRICLLDYPFLRFSSGDSCPTFASQLASELRELLALGIAHHEKLKEIQAAAVRCSPEDRVMVAHYVGRIELQDERRVPENVLRVELAAILLSGFKIPRDKGDERRSLVRTMLALWQSSEVEMIRMRGLTVGLMVGI